MKSLLKSALVMLLLVAGSAMADWAPYTQSTFDSLQQQGKPVLVWVHAVWCPTCKAQEPTLSSLLKQKEYQGIAALRVDFDSQKDVVRALHVVKQSTLVVFKGGKETGRSTGDTSREGIEHLLQKAL